MSLEPIRFRVDAPPVAQPRTKSFRYQAKDGQPKIGHYTPGRAVQDFKEQVRLACRDYASGVLLTNPLVVELHFVLARPKGMPKREAGRRPHWKRPDIDNLVKAFFDALSGWLWKDDAQVFAKTVSKWWGAEGERPFVECGILPIAGPTPPLVQLEMFVKQLQPETKCPLFEPPES